MYRNVTKTRVGFPSINCVVFLGLNVDWPTVHVTCHLLFQWFSGSPKIAQETCYFCLMSTTGITSKINIARVVTDEGVAVW